jgi:penicillin-binding protein 2
MTVADRAVCDGALKIGNRVFGCWNKHGHGSVDALMAMRQSCDVWFYLRGMATGVELIARTASEFGLGQTTGWDGGDERAGLVPTSGWKKAAKKERWWDGDTAQMAIGQSFLLATPLQMASMAATLANRGTVWRPFVVKRVESATGELLQATKPEVRRRLSASPQVIETVRQALLGAIQGADGTGHSAAVKKLSVAGKTGTAEFDVYENGVRVARINRTWFIGFAPYENPQVALAVLVEDGESGGHTAAPVAGRILAGTFGTAAEKVVRSGAYAD